MNFDTPVVSEHTEQSERAEKTVESKQEANSEATPSEPTQPSLDIEPVETDATVPAEALASEEQETDNGEPHQVEIALDEDTSSDSQVAQDPQEVAEVVSQEGAAVAEVELVAESNAESGTEEVQDVPEEKTEVAEAKADNKTQNIRVPIKRISHPMAKPRVIEEGFADIDIVALDESLRPEIKISGKAAAILSVSAKANAPMTKPESLS